MAKPRLFNNRPDRSEEPADGADEADEEGEGKGKGGDGKRTVHSIRLQSRKSNSTKKRGISKKIARIRQLEG